jgi:hypothetical protein
MMPDSPSAKQQEKDLASTRQEVRNLTVMALRPDLSPEKRELIRNLERSARAEVKLWVKALVYQRGLERKSR